MAKFCGKCGAKLDESIRFCPNCGNAVNVNPREKKTENPEVNKKTAKAEKKKLKKQTKKAKKKEKLSKLTFKERVKRFFIKLILVSACISIFVGCGVVALVYYDVLEIPYLSNVVDSASVKISQSQDAKAIEKAFNDEDIEKIDSLIFGVNTIELDDNIDFDLAINDGFNSNGLISYILKKINVAFVKKEKDTILYKVIAPDMAGVFDDAGSIQTQEELLNHIMAYADSAQLIEKEVLVDYVVVDGELKINYQTTEFIDALLGGLISEYQALYQKAIDEMMQ